MLCICVYRTELSLRWLKTLSGLLSLCFFFAFRPFELIRLDTHLIKRIWQPYFVEAPCVFVVKYGRPARLRPRSVGVDEGDLRDLARADTPEHVVADPSEYRLVCTLCEVTRYQGVPGRGYDQRGDFDVLEVGTAQHDDLAHRYICDLLCVGDRDVVDQGVVGTLDGRRTGGGLEVEDVRIVENDAQLLIFFQFREVDYGCNAGGHKDPLWLWRVLVSSRTNN